MADERFEPDLLALESAAAEVPVDDVIRLLGEPTARTALVYCYDQRTPTLEELADAVAGAAACADETIATPADRDRIRIRLYHSILPRLNDLEFVAVDYEANTVTETTIPDPVVAYLGIEE